jgi:hypothetical protein
MFTKMKQEHTPHKAITLKQLRYGQLFVFHTEGHQDDQVYMRLKEPTGPQYAASDYALVSSMKSGDLVSVPLNSEVHPVEATMEWHLKPWSVQV